LFNKAIWRFVFPQQGRRGDGNRTRRFEDAIAETVEWRSGERAPVLLMGA
jgi:hypothetical protein